MKYERPKKNRIRLGVYHPHVHGLLDEEYIKDLRDAGIDFPIVNFRALSQEEMLNLFDLYEKYGIEFLYSDGKIMSPYTVVGSSASLFDSKKAEAANYYKDHPAFAGNSFVDEPGIIHFEELGKTIEEYKRMFPGKVPYVNLLPMYASNEQLTGGAWMSKIDYYDTSQNDFREYLSKYIEYVDTDYICVDIYPCFTKDGQKTTYGDYVKAIELTAEACRDSGRDFWVCVQTCSWHPDVRIPDETDYRWQVYTMLAFGAKTLFYYVYADDKVHSGSPIGTKGEKNHLWYVSARMAKELSKISDTYVKYNYVGAFPVNCTEDTPYLEMFSPLEKFAPMLDIESDQPTLVGCFEKNDGSGYAFVLVNMTDPASLLPLEAKIKLSGEATAYVAGDPLALSKDSGGYVHFMLAGGDGVFVTVE